jgi:hypothetical protein
VRPRSSPHMRVQKECDLPQCVRDGMRRVGVRRPAVSRCERDDGRPRHSHICLPSSPLTLPSPHAFHPLRSYYNLSRFNERFERAYVNQAREDVRWQSRHKELLDQERALMGSVPGWVVGQRRYFTTWEERPQVDGSPSKSGKPGPW